jgi:ribose/xylose/arabinose/galactoside ABC-type transport system permease subunit
LGARARKALNVDPQILGLIIFLVLLVIGFGFASPYFLTLHNLTNMLLSVSVLGTMAAMSTPVLIARGLDLSVGSVVGLRGVAAALVIKSSGLVAAGLITGLAVSGLCGLVNAALFVHLGINSIIVTIGTLSIYRGAAFVISNGQTANVFSEPMLLIGAGRFVGIPYSVMLMLVLFLTCHFVATYTTIGRTLYAIGANPRASTLSGVHLGRHRYGAFIMNGVCAGLAGLLLIGQAATAVPTAGTGYELLYQIPEGVTRWGFPNRCRSDSRWRTKEVRHVDSDTIATGF